MKGIKKTLIAGALACTAFNAKAEVSSFNYGIKAGGSISSVARYGEAKINDKKAKSSFFGNPFIFANLYGEYAFTDLIGIGLEAGYMKQGGSLEGEEVKQADDSSTTPSISMISDGIAVPLYVSFYPFGREEEEGILKIHLGISGYFPLKTSCKKDDQDLNLIDGQKKEYPSLDITGHVGMGYEFPFGLSIEAKYDHGIMNRFKTENDNPQTIFTKDNALVTDLKNMKWQHMTVGLGYNFASLFS